MDTFYLGYSIKYENDMFHIQKESGDDKISENLEFIDMDEAKRFIESLNTSYSLSVDNEIANIQKHMITVHGNIGNLQNRIKYIENQISDLNISDEVGKKGISKSLKMIGDYITNFESAPAIINNEAKLLEYRAQMIDNVSAALKVLDNMTGDEYNWERTVPDENDIFSPASESIIVRISQGKEEQVSPDFAKNLVSELIDVGKDESEYPDGFEIDVDLYDDVSDYVT